MSPRRTFISYQSGVSPRYRLLPRDTPAISYYLVASVNVELLSKFLREDDLPAFADFALLAAAHTYSYHIRVESVFGLHRQTQRTSALS
jgi:hypothetical protein